MSTGARMLKKTPTFEFAVIASGLDPEADDVFDRFYEAGCDDATENGVWENVMRRTVLSTGHVGLVFDQFSDGRCLTMDGSRRDLMALLDGAARGEEATICVTSTTPELPGFIEFCGMATISGVEAPRRREMTPK